MAIPGAVVQAKFFGLPVSPDVTKVNVASYLLGCMSSVMFLVFLNASQVLPYCDLTL
jgi:hypothetical protein